jgi:hypothetical protein
VKTVNSLSGGKTSSYIAANYPADYDVFSLVRIEDSNCLFPDAKIRKEVEDRIQAPFIATAEDDTIIYTMLDLEQYIGRKITWVTGRTFDDVLKRGKSNDGETAIYLPNPTMRFCTTEMKLTPIFRWWKDTIGEPIEMRIGFRANEQKRANSMLEKCNSDGLSEFKDIIGRTKNGAKNKWASFAWQKPSFPLILSGIYKDNVEEFWKDKPIRFAYTNNCIGCFHREVVMLKKMQEMHPAKFDWFIKMEELSQKVYSDRSWNLKIAYSKIKEWSPQFELFEEDFNDCDSGYCGL